MKKKNLYFSVYVKDELENDIEIVGQFDNMKDLEKFFEKSKSYLYSLGINKRRNLKINLKVDNVEYCVIVDHD